MVASYSNSILVVHPDAEVRSAILGALPRHRVRQVVTPEEATTAIQSSPPEVVIAAQASARALIASLDASAPGAVRIFLREANDPPVDELEEIAGEGHLFHTLDVLPPGDELRSRIDEVLRPRVARRSEVEAIAATFRLEGTEFQARCADLSSSGAALTLGATSHVERLLPGTIIEALVLRRSSEVLLRAEKATVVSCQLQPAGEFRVGLRLVGGEPGAGAALRTIDDPVRILALLRRCRRRAAPLGFRASGASFAPTLCGAWHLAGQGARALLCAELDAQVVAGEVLEVFVDAGGASYAGQVGVERVEARMVTLSLPSRLRELHRREHMRFACSPAAPFRIRFRAPFTGQLVERPVLDLHAGGLSFNFDAATEVIAAGTVIGDLELIGPDELQHHLTAEVRTVSALPRELPGLERPHRCGLRLIDVPSGTRVAISDAFVAARCPPISDARSVEFGDLWDLIGRAGHYYPDYPTRSGAHVAELATTQRKLSASGEGLFKSFVYRDDEGMRGYIGGARLYSRTWMLQHLSVVNSPGKRGNPSRDLLALGLDHVETLDDVDFVRVIWRTENRWPNRLLTWIRRSLCAHGLDQLRTYIYCRLPREAELAPAGALASARSATPAELRRLEVQLRQSGQLLRMRSDDLVAGEFSLATVCGRFAQHGLERRREVLVAGSAGPDEVFGFLESSSPGLCWPEVTNGLQLFASGTGAGSETARRSVVRRAVELSRAAGRPSLVVQASDEAEEKLLVGEGFTSLGAVAEWTVHRSKLRGFHHLLTGLLERTGRR